MTEQEELQKLTEIIERSKGFIESHIFQLCDWMKKKYQLEDRLAKLRNTATEAASWAEQPQQPHTAICDLYSNKNIYLCSTIREYGCEHCCHRKRQ